MEGATSIPSGITRADVLAAIKDLDNGLANPFGDSTGYDLIKSRRRYPPKAVVGLAARRVLGRALRPDEFSGGGDTGQANSILQRLGFEVAPKLSNWGEDWTADEIDTVVRSYEKMLEAELSGLPMVKADEERRLMGLLGRSRGSVEYKLENVSAVLNENGLPWIFGFKPARNYQRQLREPVLARLGGLLKTIDDLPDATSAPSESDRSMTTDDVRVAPPSVHRRRAAATTGPNLSQGAWGAMRDAANRRLGDAGEEWVLGLEKAKLTAARRHDLAEQVVWVARTIGDGLGYDILSFDLDGAELHIEVKTTKLGPAAAFFLSPNELRVSKEQPDSFRLYRVFGLSARPRLYVLAGPLDDKLDLEVAQWTARPCALG